jgi:histidyl-tRNA synthetase
MFAGKQIPAVGISIGVERILSMAERGLREQQGGVLRGSATDVLVASVWNDDGEYVARKQLAAQLRARGVACELLHDVRPSYKRQIDYATKNHIPLMAILDGTDRVKIKHKFIEVHVTAARAPDLLERIVRERLYEHEGRLRALLSA